MKNADVAYRYYNPFNQSYTNIAFCDRISHPYYFKEVLDFGISQIIKDMNIPYDIDSSLGSSLWIFHIDGDDGDFKVSWEFEGKTPYSLKIGYYEEDNLLDQQVLYDYTTYEEALNYVQNYITEILTNGVPQEPEVEYDEAIVSELKLMHGLMQSMNDEDAYYSWITTGVPDGATEDDFIYIASDADEFKHCKNLFDRLFVEYSVDGLYKPTPEEVEYAEQTCKRLGLPDIEIL